MDKRGRNGDLVARIVGIGEKNISLERFLLVQMFFKIVTSCSWFSYGVPYRD